MKTKERIAVRTSHRYGDSERYWGHDVFMTDDLTNEFYETWDVAKIPPTRNDKYYQVSPGEEGLHGLILIAYNHYSRPDLWWVIATANGVFHPTTEVVSGMTLRIPHLPTFLARVT